MASDARSILPRTVHKLPAQIGHLEILLAVNGVNFVAEDTGSLSSMSGDYHTTITREQTQTAYACSLAGIGCQMEAYYCFTTARSVFSAYLINSFKLFFLHSS